MTSKGLSKPAINSTDDLFNGGLKESRVQDQFFTKGVNLLELLLNGSSQNA